MNKDVTRTLYITLGILIICLSLPLVLNKIPPNGAYGFRTPATLSNSAIWYQVNSYGAKLLLEAELVMIITASLLSMSPKISEGTYTVICMLVMIIGIFLSIGLSLKYQTDLISHMGYIATTPLNVAGAPSPYITAFLYLIINITMIVVSVPMVQRRVAPNPWYGFRTRQTLSSPDVWYAANAFSGRLMLTASIINIVLDLILLFVIADPLLYMMLCSFCLIVGLTITTGISFSYMKSLG